MRHVCKFCLLSLEGIERFKGEDNYNRLCPCRDGDMCERNHRMPKKKITVKSALPKTIYVIRDPNTSDEPILVAYEDYAEIDDALKVGIYELKETARKIVTHGLANVTK